MDFPLNGLTTEEFGVCPPATPCESPSPLLPTPTSAFSGRVLCSLINAIFIDFVDEDTGQSCLARCTPGKMYLNGRRNLLSLLRTPAGAAALLPPGTPVRMRVAKAAKEQKLLFFKDEYGNHTVTLDLDESSPKARFDPMKRLLRTGKEKNPRTCSYVVVQVWSEAWGQDLSADLLKLPNRQFLQSVTPFDNKADGMLLRLHECVFEPDKERKKTLQGAVAAAVTPWFMVDHLGPLARSAPRWPETPATLQPVRATVAELHRPSGGVLFLGQEYVYFHRSRLLVDGVPLCYTDDLDEMIAVGDPVIVHVVDNAAHGRTPILDRCPTSRVALWAQKGAAELTFGRVPSKIAANAAAAFAEATKIKVVDFAENTADGSVSAGVGVVCHPSSNIAVTVKLQKLIGSYVYFEAKDLNYFGVSLAGTDLAQIMRLQDEIYVNLVEVPETDRAALGFGGKCSHRASKGGTMAKIEPNNTALGSWPCFLPSSCITHLALHRRGLHYTQLEKAAHRRQKGRWRVMRDAGLAAAAVTDFVEPNAGLPLNRIRVTVLCGPLRGRVLEADRAICEVFGRSMAAADLSAFVQPYETVYVSVSAAGTICNKLYVGRPIVQSADVRTMSQRERLDLLTYLQSHVLSMSEFKEALRVVGPPRLTFLPFPRNLMQARVIDLGIDIRPGVGNMSAVGIVDQGYISEGDPSGSVKSLKREPVFIPASAVWVFGYSAAKMDLSYLLAKNQKMVIETVLITDSDRQKFGTTLPAGIKYRAQLAWMGPSRPKCDRTKDTNLNDVGVRDWLQKRHLSLDQLKEMSSGQGCKQNPAVNRDSRGFALTEDLAPLSPAMRSDALESIDYTRPLSNDIISDKKNSIPSLLGSLGGGQPKSLGDLMAQEQPEPFDRGFGRRGPLMGMGSMGGMGMGMGGPMMQPYPMDNFAPGPHWRHLPVLRHGPQVAHMVEAAATATGPRDPTLMHLIEDDAMAQQAHHISQALQFSLDFYKEKVGLNFGPRKTKLASNGSSAGKPAKIQALGDLVPDSMFQNSKLETSQSQQKSFFGDSAATWDKLFNKK